MSHFRQPKFCHVANLKLFLCERGVGGREEERERAEESRKMVKESQYDVSLLSAKVLPSPQSKAYHYFFVNEYYLNPSHFQASFIVTQCRRSTTVPEDSGSCYDPPQPHPPSPHPRYFSLSRRPVSPQATCRDPALPPTPLCCMH